MHYETFKILSFDCLVVISIFLFMFPLAFFEECYKVFVAVFRAPLTLITVISVELFVETLVFLRLDELFLIIALLGLYCPELFFLRLFLSKPLLLMA